MKKYLFLIMTLAVPTFAQFPPPNCPPHCPSPPPPPPVVAVDSKPTEVVMAASSLRGPGKGQSAVDFVLSGTKAIQWCICLDSGYGCCRIGDSGPYDACGPVGGCLKSTSPVPSSKQPVVSIQRK